MGSLLAPTGTPRSHQWTTATHIAERPAQPIERDLSFMYVMYVGSLTIAVLASIVSGTGLYFRDSLYAPDAFLAHDVFNLVIGLPVLIGTLWLADRAYAHRSRRKPG
jgi:hypothetical protein